MLRRWFRKPNDFEKARRLEDVQARAAAISALDETTAAKLQDELADLARTDRAAAVRARCIDKLHDTHALIALLDSPAADAAAQKLAELERDGVDIGDSTHPRLLAARARVSGSAGIDLSDVTSIDVLIELLLADPDLLEPALALPLLSREPNLSKLERASRNRNKRVNRAARQRRTALRTQRDRVEHATSEVRDHADRLRHRLDALARAPHAADVSRATHDASQVEASVQLVERAAGELADARMQLDPNNPTPAAEAEVADLIARARRWLNAQAAADSTAAPDQDLPDAETLDQHVRQLEQRLSSGEHPSNLQDAITRLAELGTRILESGQLSSDVRQRLRRVDERFETLKRAYAIADEVLQALPESISPPGSSAEATHHRALLDRVRSAQQRIRWPDWAESLPPRDRLDHARQHLEEHLGTFDASARDILAHVDTLLDDAEQALAAGESARAHKHAAEVFALIRDNGVTLPGPQARRLHALTDRTRSLADWAAFATHPHREELVTAMRSLVEAPLEPEAQAARIKELRKQWNALGRPTNAPDWELSRAFDDAAETAFAPCREHFAALADQRRTNLRIRTELCDMMESYIQTLDSATLNIKDSLQILRQARTEWSDASPVDRKAARSTVTRFEDLQSRLHNLIQHARTLNLQRKESLVTEAAALQDSDAAFPDKVERVKSLQQAWRDIGPGPRRADQQVWERFRAACDAVFAVRDEQRSRDAEERAQQATRARTAVAALADAVDARTGDTATPAELRSLSDTAAHQISQVQSRDERASLERALDEHQTRYRSLLDSAARASKAASLRSLLSYEAELDARWSADASAGTGSAQAPPALTPAMDPDVLRERLPDLWAATPACAPEDPARLVVLAELQAGVPSPAEAEPLRMSVQVERLNASLGRDRLPQGPDELITAWCTLGPKQHLADSAELRARFHAAMEQLAENAPS